MNLKYIMSLFLVLGLAACSNQDIVYPDYDTQAGYFPYQTPIRTLILGNYDQGINENDNNKRFEIGVTMSGYIKTKKTVRYTLNWTTACSIMLPMCRHCRPSTIQLKPKAR